MSYPTPTPAELADIRNFAEERLYGSAPFDEEPRLAPRRRQGEIILWLLGFVDAANTADVYQQEAAVTLKTVTQRDTLNLCALGLGGEAGEVLEAAIAVTAACSKVSERLKKYLFHGKDLNEEDLALELGDVQWYTAIAAKAIGRPLSSIMRGNIAKLRARAAARAAAEAK